MASTSLVELLLLLPVGAGIDNGTLLTVAMAAPVAMPATERR